ncbi:hypothetical protein [Pseudarthrobacter equi]|nr:hypothetical protein [Pseudarthrobacter equi]
MIPDLIVALVTGVAVGLAILIAERMSAIKAEKRKLEQLGTRLVHPLLLVLQRPEYFPRFDKIGELQKKQREAMKILEDPDLDDWHETSPSSLTKALVKYRNALRDQRHDREDLAQTIKDWDRVHGKEPNILEYAEARLLDANEQALRDLFPDKAERVRLETEFGKLREHGHVKSHARAFRGARARSERAQGDAHEELVAQIKATHAATPRAGR